MRKPLRRQIRTSYRALSTINTSATFLTLSPFRIVRHLLRKIVFRYVGRMTR